MLPILHVVHSMHPSTGGVAEAVRVLVRSLSYRGVSSEIASLDDSDAQIHSSAPLHRFGPGVGSYGLSLPLLAYLRTEIHKFAVVIIHGHWQFHSAAVVLAVLWSTFRPIVYVMPHGMPDPWFAKAYPVKHIKKRLYWGILERHTIGMASKVLFTSTCEKQLAISGFLKGMSPSKGEVLGFGIEKPPIRNDYGDQTATAPREFDRPFILFLGRLHPKKGVDLLLQGFASIASDSPELLLVIAGPGDRQYVEDLKAIALELGIESRIRWHGMVTGDQKWNLLEQAELFALPSHQENFGIAIAEALASGTPVLLSRQVNIWAEVLDGGAGFVCEDNSASVSSVLRSWLEKHSGVADTQIRARARATFENHFDIVNTGARLKQILDRSLGK